MTAERWAAVTTLVEQALSLPPAERPAFLRAAAASPDLIAEAEQLLALEPEASQLFPIERWRTAPTPTPALTPGTSIGRYLLLEEIGRGGMGTVFRARRADGVYQQEVALKVLGEGLNTQALAHRFEAERQILAGLTHPGIARLLDGGVTPNGQPFLVLEYVEGEPIDRFCDEHNLALEDRLRLFLKVAASVQFAHQQLVLHLDLKPANILVTPAGEPRLLDFGIARILEEAEGGWQALATVQLMTPRYASPEQIRGAKLGVGSDVFSLATLLYRLLTGHFPYELDGRSALEAARIVCEQPPRPPSAVAPPALCPALQGDLDAILLCALRKEPEHRYPTVAAFAADLERHLAQRPVEARTHSLQYTASRFLRRHRTAALASAAVLLILIASAAAVLRYAVVAREQRAEAERQRAAAVQRFADLRTLAHSYVFDLDKQLEPIPGTVKVRAFVMQNALRYLEAMSREAGTDDDLAREVGLGYSQVAFVQADESMPSLNDRAGALASIGKALAIQRRLFDKNRTMAERAQLLRLMRVQDQQLVTSGDPVAAAAVIDQAWTFAQPMIAAGPATPRFMYIPWLAWDMVLVKIGNGDIWNLADPVGAEPWLDRSRDFTLNVIATHPELAKTGNFVLSLQNLDVSRAALLTQLGREAEAEPFLRHALSLSSSDPGSALNQQAHKAISAVLCDLLIRLHRFPEAAALLARIPAQPAKEAGADRVETADDAELLTVQARIDFGLAHAASARARMLRALAIYDPLYRADPDEVSVSSSYAVAFFDFAGQPSLPTAQRIAFYTRAETIARTYASTHPRVLSATLLTGKCELALAQLAQSAHQRDSLLQHTTAARTAAQTLLRAYPIQPEASTLLAAANKLTP